MTFIENIENRKKYFIVLIIAFLLGAFAFNLYDYCRVISHFNTLSKVESNVKIREAIELYLKKNNSYPTSFGEFRTFLKKEKPSILKLFVNYNYSLVLDENYLNLYISCEILNSDNIIRKSFATIIEKLFDIQKVNFKEYLVDSFMLSSKELRTIKLSSTIDDSKMAVLLAIAEKSMKEYSKQLPDGYFFYDKMIDIKFSYNLSSDNYYFESDSPLDSVSEEYIVKLKYAISNLLRDNDVERISLKLNMPYFSPIPPPPVGKW